jgi:hypothetical protein
MNNKRTKLPTMLKSLLLEPRLQPLRRYNNSKVDVILATMVDVLLLLLLCSLYSYLTKQVLFLMRVGCASC